MNRLLKLPYEEYDKLPGEHATRLRAMLTSPLHYYDLEIHPREDRPCLSLGIHAHAVVLEPETVDGTVEVWTGGRKQGNAWGAFQVACAAAGKRIVTAAEHEAAEEIAVALRVHPIAGVVLQHYEAELAMQWQDAGAECKGRLDLRRTVTEDLVAVMPELADYLGRKLLGGIKTSADPTERSFRTAAERYGYVLQWGMYARGHEVITGDRGATVEIVVGAKRPHEVFVYLVPEQVIDDGIDQYRTCLQRVSECRASGKWPGRGMKPVTFERASWAIAEEDDFEMQEAS